VRFKPCSLAAEPSQRCHQISVADRSALDAAMRLVESADERNVDADRPAA